MENMTIATNLKTLRDKRGLTQTQLADLAGLGINQVSRIERGTSKPELETIKKLAIALHCTADDLIFDSQELTQDDQIRTLLGALIKMPEDKKQTAIELLEALVMKAEAENWIKK